MTIFAKKLGIALLTAVTALAPLNTAAQAGDGWIDSYGGSSRLHNYREYSDEMQQRQQRHVYRPRYKSHGYRHYRNNDDAIALGIIGLGVGAIIGGAIANSHNPRVIYRQPGTRVISGGGYEPWSRSWYRYCSNKYRSFNASTGTYRGYDGRDHFCVVR